MFGRKSTYPESVLFLVLLAVLGRCDKHSVSRDKRKLDNMYLNDNLSINTDDGCDRVMADIDECVDCYPCEHEKVKGQQGLNEISVRVKPHTCSANAYITLCCISSKANVLSTRSSSSNLNTCGLRKLGGVGSRSQVVSSDGLQNTAFAEFPWVVAVLSKCLRDYYFRCVGSLINGRTVLTSAHCVSSVQRYCSFRVRAGKWHLSSNDTEFPYRDADVSEVIIHDDFNNHTLENNIALLVLSSQIEPAEHIGFVCLDDNSAPREGSECYVAGWGVAQGSKERHRDIMRYVKMTYLNRNECERRLRNFMHDEDFKLDRSYMCALGEGGEVIRKGDGGAALVCALKDEDNRFVQYGIATLFPTFGLTDAPSVFTNTVMFKSWIDVKIDKLFSDDETLLKDTYII